MPAGVPATTVTWDNAVTADGEPLNGTVEIDPGQELNFPDATPPTSYIGPAVGGVINGVLTPPMTVPDDVAAIEGGFTYTVTVRPAGGQAWSGTTTAITGETVDLSDVELAP